MDLIVGGAYQGKLEYMKNEYGFSDEDIFFCSDGMDICCLDEIKGSRAVYGLEKLTLEMVRKGITLDELKEVILGSNVEAVCINDISCGVVPIEKDIRAWREESGRLMNALAKEADGVVRIFCGIPMALKEKKND